MALYDVRGAGAARDRRRGMAVAICASKAVERRRRGVQVNERDGDGVR